MRYISYMCTHGGLKMVLDNKEDVILFIQKQIKHNHNDMLIIIIIIINKHI